jgi:hypothetical protein
MQCGLRDDFDGGAASDRDEYAASCWNDDSIESRRMDALDRRSRSLVWQDEHSHRSAVCLHHEMWSERAVKPAGLCIRDPHDSGTQMQSLTLEQRSQFGFRHDIQRMDERSRFLLSVRDDIIGKARASA